MKFNKDTYLKQINDYYNQKLKSHVIINLGITPQYLVDYYGAPKLPLVMQQSTLTKCIRKKNGSRSAHNLSKNIIEYLPEQIENPVFLIKDKSRNSIVLISDAHDQNKNNILIAIKLNEKRKEIQVNEIKSVYGKTSLKEYLQKHITKNQLYIINNKKAEILSRVIGLQLPKALINSSYKKRIASESEKVNQNFPKASPQDTLLDNNFQLLGKRNMLALLKSQIKHSRDFAANVSDYKYTKFDNTSERLEYTDDHGDHHDLYHSVIAGKEMCLYHINNGRNQRIEIPGRTAVKRNSVVGKLSRISHELNDCKDNQQLSKDNNLEQQRNQKER